MGRWNVDSRISALLIKEDEMKGRNEPKRGNYDCSTLHKPDCGKEKKGAFRAQSALLSFEWIIPAYLWSQHSHRACTCVFKTTAELFFLNSLLWFCRYIGCDLHHLDLLKKPVSIKRDGCFTTVFLRVFWVCCRWFKAWSRWGRKKVLPISCLGSLEVLVETLAPSYVAH